MLSIDWWNISFMWRTHTFSILNSCEGCAQKYTSPYLEYDYCCYRAVCVSEISGHFFFCSFLVPDIYSGVYDRIHLIN